ncbi:MAG: PQQ-binding-like beta-propeller repeat protein [Actinomycetota bacterium]
MKRFLLSLVFGVGGLLALSACQPDPGCAIGGGPGGPTFSAGGLASPAQALDDCPPPPPDCPGCGEGHGEPHFSTFDERHYSLQTAAELVGARSDDGRFEVQWRQEPYTDNVSGITAVAVRIAESRVTVVGEDEQLRVDGEVVELEVGEAFRTPGGALVHRTERRIVVEGPDGDGVVHIQPHPRMIGLLVDPPEDERGSLEGLLGDADGDPTNDLVLADGSLLIDETWEDLHPGLAEAWRVTDATTLFDYEDGLGPDDYWDPTFPAAPLRLEDFSDEERAEADAICRAAGVSEQPRLDRCMFDVLVTGDPGVAELAAQQQEAAGVALSPSGGEDDPSELADIAVSWSTLVPDTGDPWISTLVGDVVVVQANGLERSRSLLIGLSAEDGEELWRVEGVHPYTRVGVDGDVVLAVGEGNGPLAGPDGNPSLVAIDVATGEVLDDRRHDPDRAAGERGIANTTELLPLGDVLVVVAGGWLQGYDLADLTPVWSTELEAGNAFDLVPVDDEAWVGWREGEVTRIARLDPADGAVTVEAELDGRLHGRRGVIGTPDGGLVVGLTGGGERIVALDGDGDEIWEVTLGDDQRAPRWFTVAGDTVVGFTGGQEVSALDLDDGSVRWTARPTSFTNNDGQVIGLDDGTVVLASFGGAYLEAYGPDGAEAWVVPSEVVFKDGGAPAVSVLGPLTEDDVIGISRAEGGLLLVAVPSTGPHDR